MYCFSVIVFLIYYIAWSYFTHKVIEKTFFFASSLFLCSFLKDPIFKIVSLSIHGELKKTNGDRKILIFLSPFLKLSISWFEKKVWINTKSREMQNALKKFMRFAISHIRVYFTVKSFNVKYHHIYVVPSFYYENVFYTLKNCK